MSHPDPTRDYSDCDYDDGKPSKVGHEECEVCDGEGVIYNNADPTSGQWIECDAKKPLSSPVSD